MSHYPPPPPPFGGEFNSNAPFTLYTSANLPRLPHNAYRPPSTTNPVPANTPFDTQHVNAFSFDSNRQGTFTSSNVNGNTAASFIAPNQLPDSSPHPTTSQSALLPRYPFQSQNAPASFNSSHDKLQHSQASQPKLAKLSGQTSKMDTGAVSTAALSDLEDGELSDGDSGEKPGAQLDEVSRPHSGLNSHGNMNEVGIISDRLALPVFAHQKGIILDSTSIYQISN